MTRVRIADPGTARGNLSRKMAIVIRQRMHAAGRLMVQDATLAMGSTWNLDRPFERRRWPGSVRAANALDYTVEGGPELPLKLGYRVKGGAEVRKRIIGLNWGIPGHNIQGGTDTWPLKGQYGITRTQRAFGASQNRRPDLLAWVDESGDVLTSEVDHPGNGAGAFLEEALQAATERIKRR